MDNKTPLPPWWGPRAVRVEPEKNEAEVVRNSRHPLIRCFPNYKSTPEKTQPKREIKATTPKRALIKPKLPLSRNPGKVAQKLKIEHARKLLEALVTQTQTPQKRR